jgi:signal peptidase II
LLVAAAVVLVDQLTKILAHQHLRGRGAVAVVPGWFDLTYSRNPGGVFGYFTELGDPWRTLLLSLLPLLAIVIIGGLLWRGRVDERRTALGLSLVLGGALGNLIDRVLRGEVIDFLDVYVPPSTLAERLQAWVGTSHWPTFNVADSAIVVGAGLLFLATLRSPSAGAPSAGAGRRDGARAGARIES